MPEPLQASEPGPRVGALPDELDRLRQENQRLKELLSLATSGHGLMLDRGRGVAQPIHASHLPGRALRASASQPAVRAEENRYRLVRRLGTGGMAEVYLGVAESVEGFSRPVAIKRILPTHSRNQQFRNMFLDEARLSLSLQHAGIVQVFDVGRAERSYFIVMEYVDGVDLRQILQWRHRIGAHLPVRLAVHVALELCGGLAYAHERADPLTGAPLGIVHRDISPSNVLISEQGEVKILDFGVAKTTQKVAVTDPGTIKGKLGYLAPEMARGEPVDHRADIYAVGILLYEMLCSRRLFYGADDLDTVLRAQDPKIPSISAQNPDVDPALEAVVRRALSPDPADRYDSAADLADELAEHAYAHRLKVTRRDVARLVRRCAGEAGPDAASPRTPSPVHPQLQQEVEQFESLIFDVSMVQRDETIVLSDPEELAVVDDDEEIPLSDEDLLEARALPFDSQNLPTLALPRSGLFDRPVIETPAPEPTPWWFRLGRRVGLLGLVVLAAPALLTS